MAASSSRAVVRGGAGAALFVALCWGWRAAGPALGVGWGCTEGGWRTGPTAVTLCPSGCTAWMDAHKRMYSSLAAPARTLLLAPALAPDGFTCCGCLRPLLSVLSFAWCQQARGAWSAWCCPCFSFLPPGRRQSSVMVVTEPEAPGAAFAAPPRQAVWFGLREVWLQPGESAVD